ncbi:amino acid adenylation domain-containing protein [Tenacibaculum sp.]|uniref:amino acid adenylation domain-containing protein n=1 Tax=Tenacibaculum sp. TaxID=1906242 RepID=UPI003D0D8532
MKDNKIIQEYWFKKIDQYTNENDRYIPYEDIPSGSVSRQVKRESLEGINVLTKQNSIAEYAIYLSIYKGLIKRYTEQDSVWVSSPIIYLDEEKNDEEGLFFYNVDISNEQTIKDIIVAVKAEIEQTISYGQIDYKILQERFAYNGISKDDYLQYGFNYTKLSKELDVIKETKLSLSIDKNEKEEITIHINYDAYKYEETFINNFLNGYISILENIKDYLSEQLITIEIVSDQEKETLLRFSESLKNEEINESVIANFHQQVEETPNNIALVHKNKKYAYTELNEQANRLAFILREQFDIKRNDVVGVITNYSEDTIISFIAILKLGATYLPLDPLAPDERLKYIIKDTAPKAIVIQLDYLNDVIEFDIPIFSIDVMLNEENLEGYNAENIEEKGDVAYLMYTSGSTGIPKGVIIENKGITRLVKNTDYVQVNSHDRVLGISNPVFDGSTFDIWSALLNGATLYIPEKDLVLNFQLLAEEIVNNEISVAFMTTVLFNSLVDSDIQEIGCLRKILFGGEKVSVHHVNKFIERFGKGKLLHVYGPTENTTFSTFYEVNETHKSTVPIGSPIANTQCYILNENKALQPIGVPGELYVAGLGVAKGYLNKEELTSKSFINNPYQKDSILYKTGDICKWLSNGSIEFIGRKDNQVKIRGFRIELGEIEQRILELDKVFETTIVVSNDSNNVKFLSAFVCGKENLDLEELKSSLKEKLPAYMIPTYITQVDVMPLTRNGKIDKKRLLEIEQQKTTKDKEIVEPKNETEKKLVDIWKTILEKDSISITDDFFDLGGHSLKVTRLISRLHKEFNIKLELKQLFETTILEEQARLIDGAARNTYNQIPKAEELPFYPLSSSQKRLWILSQFDEVNVAYNMPIALEFKGEFKYESLVNAFNDLIKRHEILRTVFKENEEGEVNQYVLPFENINFEISYHGLEEVSNHQTIVLERIKEDFDTNFNLELGPLLKASIYQVEKDRWIFSYVMHHIISDGWSMDVLINELLKGYNDHNQFGQTIVKEELEVQYKDYAVWQQSQLKENQLETHKDFWTKQFEGEIPVLQLPEDKIRPEIQTYNGKLIKTRISASIVNKLKSQINEERVTLFISLLTAVKILLHRYTNAEDIIIGSPIANREHADLENQIGFYLNTLALRTQFKSTHSFKELLEIVKQNTLEAYKHQIYPFDELINNLNIRKDMSRGALFDVMVVLQNATSNNLIQNKEYEVDGLHISNFHELDYEVSKFDLSFNFIEIDDELEVEIEYNNDIYYEETAQRMLKHLKQVLISVTDNPNLPVGKIDILSQEEKKLLLENFRTTKKREITETSVIYEFEKAVRKYSEKTAFLFEDKIFTYEKLNRRANQLAHYLKENFTVGPDTLIGIELERSEWIPISMLAILKTGSAYLPIDVQLPQERIDFMKSDSNCSCIIDKSELLKFEESKEALDNSNLDIKVNKSDLAYLMYTSGSTGTPKGVMIENESMLDYCLTFIETFGLGETDAVIQQSSISFDTHVEEIFPTLIAGGTLLMGTNGGRDIKEIQCLIEEKNATILSTTPLILKALNESELNLNKLRLMISGGDKLSRNYISSFFNRVEIYDTYGPTESTVCSTYSRIDNTQENCIIGKPITNRGITITNDNGVLQPIGIAGEIRISGSGLARGYKNEETLTAEKFLINNDFVREYKTGDLGKWLPNGSIEFIGRKDNQVKIRGYRVELGEIENTIQNYSTVESAAVLVVKNEEEIDELVTYLVTGEDFDILEVRRYLNSRLPSYMIPAKYIKIDEMPLNTNGKINKKILHEEEGSLINSGTPFEPARNEIEDKLTNIWKEILQKERIGIYDNFFDIGGQSIKATQLINKINESFSVKIKIKRIFEDPTISGISEHMKFMLQQKELQKNKQELQEINLD